MPEGLAQTMTTQEVVDLLSYLTTLRRPVSIVGQYQTIGPLSEPNGTRLIDPVSLADARMAVSDGQGRELAWRKISTNAEGLADFTTVTGTRAGQAAYTLIPILSPEDQQASLVIDTPIEVSAWLNGKPVVFSAATRDRGEPYTAALDLPRGSSRLCMRLVGNGDANLAARVVTTLVTDKPVGFDSGAAAPASGTNTEGQR
jgi:hypothetical protein